MAIETAFTVRLVFGLPLRQAEGFRRSVFELMGVDLAVRITPLARAAMPANRPAS